jgi:HD-GYP domain-containing protein (c-di-GMP phosphodiesterase class II)/DNA-binding CsgD family transcriptional regulator
VPSPPRFRLASLLGALSLATDRGGGFPEEAALRTAIIARRLAQRAFAVGSTVRSAYWAGLLRFLGCTAYAHEQAILVGGDDLAFLQTFADVDLASPTEMLGRAVTRLGEGTSALNRVRSVVRFLLEGGQSISAAHCELAEQLAADLGFPTTVGRTLGEMYERWDGRGAPKGLRGDAISEPARVLHVAHVMEVFERGRGWDRAVAEVSRRRGTHFEPRLVDAVESAGKGLVDGLTSGSVWQVFLDEEPEPRDFRFGWDELRAVARAFGVYADVKLPFMLGHSDEVARLAVAGARCLSLDTEAQAKVEIAAFLHDLGRVGVKNGIWDKAGPLNTAEWEQVRLHAYHTQRILAHCPELREVAEIAGSAHERLDGTGYPRELPASSVTQAMQLLAAADVWVSLRSHRPHRAAFDRAAARHEIGAMVASGTLSAGAVSAVLAADGDSAALPAAPRPAGLTEREVEVLVLVARGMTNKEIALELGLSPRTVQTHVGHCFEKTGVNTRAAAATFAARHGLSALAKRRD